METIEDIVREMREAAMTQNCVDSAEGLALASRIEAAINPTIMAAQAEVMCRDGVPMERFNGVVMELTRARDEIALLRAALAPILAIPTDALTGLWGFPLPDGGMTLTPEGLANALRFVNAVRECKRIYNGEGDGE